MIIRFSGRFSKIVVWTILQNRAYWVCVRVSSLATATQMARSTMVGRTRTSGRLLVAVVQLGNVT